MDDVRFLKHIRDPIMMYDDCHDVESAIGDRFPSRKHLGYLFQVQKSLGRESVCLLNEYIIHLDYPLVAS